MNKYILIAIFHIFLLIPDLFSNYIEANIKYTGKFGLIQDGKPALLSILSEMKISYDKDTRKGVLYIFKCSIDGTGNMDMIMPPVLGTISFRYDYEKEKSEDIKILSMDIKDENEEKRLSAGSLMEMIGEIIPIIANDSFWGMKEFDLDNLSLITKRDDLDFIKEINTLMKMDDGVILMGFGDFNRTMMVEGFDFNSFMTEKLKSSPAVSIVSIRLNLDTEKIE
jgi:hypothetical protein